MNKKQANWKSVTLSHASAGARGELALLGEIRRRAAKNAGGLRLGIGDDCALLSVRPGEELAVTTDLSIDGRHFRLKWHPAEAIGHKTLARGLSDLAAMGARPVAAFLSLGLPRELADGAKGKADSWVARFLDGLMALAEAHGTPLAGGDLAESPVAVADIVLVGAVPRGKALVRSGAQVDDAIYVTGALGGSTAGLARLTELGAAGKGRRIRIPKSLETELKAHLYPEPRLAQGLWLQRHGVARAAIDVSDGISTDLRHICEESGVAAEIDAELVPVDAMASLEQALNGGEDYELLFTAAADARVPRSIAGVAVTRIGRIVRRRTGQPLVTLIAGGKRQPLERRGWEHFH